MTSLTYPFRESDVRALRAGDAVSINGIVWTGRDRFHKHFADGGKLPVDFRGRLWSVLQGYRLGERRRLRAYHYPRLRH